MTLTSLYDVQVYADYLREARESLYLTLDRLQLEPAGHPLNSQIGDAVEEVGYILFHETYITALISIHVVKFISLFCDSDSDFISICSIYLSYIAS